MSAKKSIRQLLEAKEFIWARVFMTAFLPVWWRSAATMRA